MGITGGSQHLDDAVADVQNGHIKGTAAQVVNHDLLLAFLVQAIGQSSGSRLVDNPLHVQTGDLTGILGGLPLRVGEVSGDGDDRLGNGLAQISLGVGLQLLKNHGADLLGGVVLTVNGNVIILAHVTLDGRNGPVGVGDGLTLCHLTDHTLAGLGECHHGRGGAVAFGVGDDDGFAAFQHGNTGIGCTKVNTNNLAHNVCPPIYG